MFFYNNPDFFIPFWFSVLGFRVDDFARRKRTAVGRFEFALGRRASDGAPIKRTRRPRRRRLRLLRPQSLAESAFRRLRAVPSPPQMLGRGGRRRILRMRVPQLRRRLKQMMRAESADSAPARFSRLNTGPTRLPSILAADARVQVIRPRGHRSAP